VLRRRGTGYGPDMTGTAQRRARAAAAAAVLLCGIALSGCSDSATPTPAQSTSASTAEPTTSAEPDTTPVPADLPTPERPASMDRDDVVGAKAAAQYFVELYEYAYATGDLDEWRAIAHDECGFCKSVIDDVEQLYSGGGYMVGGNITVDEIYGSDPREGSEYFAVEIHMRQEAASEFSDAHEVVRSYDDVERLLFFAMGWSDQGWHVREGEVTAPDA
jgi:hypothetical protein